MQSVYVDGTTKTFTANGAVLANRRVKLSAGSTTKPPQVEYAGAGDACIGVALTNAADTELVTVKLLASGGTFLLKTSGGVTQGAPLYGTASGCVDDTGTGTTQFVALDAATSGDTIECALYPAVSTTAGTVSIADAGLFTATATVEAALQEIYQNAISVQGFIGIPLNTFREIATGAVGNIAANGGVLASDTTPILQPLNGATDSCQAIVWAASNNDAIMTSIPLPPNLDDTADLVLHTRIVSGGTTDAVGFTVSTWYNEGDTKIDDTSQTNQTTTWAEKITTIANGDVPSGAQTVTIVLTPVAHTTDTLSLSAAWLEYKTKILTS